MGTRLYTDEELARLGRAPWTVAVEAVNEGRAELVETTLSQLEAGFRSQMDRYTGWVGSINTFAVDRWERGGAVAMAGATRTFFATSPDRMAIEAEDPAPVAPAVVAAIGDPARAIALLEEWLDAWRHTIDLYRDWISALLGSVYRDHGPDVLEELLRFCGQQGLMGSLAEHIRRSPEERLVDFVHLLHGHFAELRLFEDESKFTIEQDPCGTCSRQVTDGRFGPPLNLPVVEEAHATTWGRGTTTIYRTHVPVWHVEMAREALGVPWPVNQCPHGLEAGVCRILLYKDPLDPAAETEVPGGAAAG